MKLRLLTGKLSSTSNEQYLTIESTIYSITEHYREELCQQRNFTEKLFLGNMLLALLRDEIEKSTKFTLCRSICRENYIYSYIEKCLEST